MVTAEMRAQTLRKLRAGSGRLTTAALKSLDENYKWFSDLPAQERSWG